MAFIRQLILALVVLGATVALWIAYVPSAVPTLERAGVFELLGMEPPPPPEAGGGPGGFGPRGPANVVVAPVTIEPINNQIEAIGDGQAQRLITVRAETGGTIRTMPVAAGSIVQEGDVIAQLEDDSERLDVQRARLALEDAQADLDRITQLADRGTVTALQTQEAQLTLRNAQLSLDSAQLALNRRTVRAAFDGTIGLIAVEPGDRINAQEEIAVLADRSRILIEFRVPERAIAQIANGQAFEVRPLALPGQVFTGEIVAIDNLVDRNTRSLRVQGRLDNEDDVLRTGMAFAVTLSIQGERLPAVDPLAVQWSSDGAFVWAVRADKAVRVPVSIQQRNPDRVLVRAELAEGEQVVIEGVQTLRPGADVAISDNRIAQTDETTAPQATQ